MAEEGGNTLPRIAKAEHDTGGGALTKKVLTYGFDGSTKRRLKADGDGHLQVDVLSGGGGGTLKTDGEAITGSDTGGIIAGKDGSNARFVIVDAQGHMQVDVLSGGGGGTQVIDGEVVDGADTAIITVGTDGSNYRLFKTDPQGHLQVDVLSGGGGGTQVIDGETINGANTAILVVGTDGTDYQLFKTDTEGHLQVDVVGAGGVVSTDNSSTSLLNAGISFTGNSEDVLKYSTVSICLFTDQDSAVDGLSIETSSDGTNWDHKDVHTISANESHKVTIGITCRYFRIVYTNGGTNQGVMRLTAQFNTVDGSISELLSGDVSDNTQVISTRAVLAAKQPSGAYTNIHATAGGNLKTSIEEFDPSVLGQDTMDNSLPVTIASDQSALPITVASLPLPSGAATSALQLPDGHNVTVDNASLAVTGSFWQATQPISVATLPLPSGAATSALQLPDGHNVTVDNASIAVTNGGTFAVQADEVDGVDAEGAALGNGMLVQADDGSVRRNILSDAQGHLQVDVLSGGGGGTQVIDGEIVSGANTAILIVGTDGSNYQLLSTNSDGKLQVEVTNTVTVDSHDVTNAGTFVVQEDGAALTALELIDDIVLAEDAIHGSGDKGVMALAVRVDDPAALAADGDYHPLMVSDKGGLWTDHLPNEVNPSNSSTTPLNSGIAFTGTGKDILEFDLVTIMMDASHDSATDGMTFQFSTDNVNWDDVYLFSYIASEGARRFQFPVTSQYFRVVFTNGGTNQTHFRLQTILHHGNSLTSIHRIGDDTSPDRSSEIVKSVIIAQQGGGGPSAGDFIPVQATVAGNLKVSMQEISDGLDIGAGNAGDETQRVSISTDDVNLSAIKTAVELLDNAVDGNYLNVNINIAGVDIIGGAGAVGAGTQRVTLASNDPAVVKLGTIDTDTGNIATDTGVIASDTTSIDGKIVACDTGAVVVASGTIDLGATDNAVLDSMVVELKVANGAYAQRTDDVGGGVTYRGWAVPGTATASAAWRITKITETAGDFVMNFADGDDSFNNVWNNRAALSYS